MFVKSQNMRKSFLEQLINKDRTNPNLIEFWVKFYDDREILVVKAHNFTMAAILAMAYRIHSKQAYGIEWIQSKVTGSKLPGPDLCK